MATAKNVPSAVANDGFAITPSDTKNGGLLLLVTAVQ